MSDSLRVGWGGLPKCDHLILGGWGVHSLTDDGDDSDDGDDGNDTEDTDDTD